MPGGSFSLTYMYVTEVERRVRRFFFSICVRLPFNVLIIGGGGSSAVQVWLDAEGPDCAAAIPSGCDDGYMPLGAPG